MKLMLVALATLLSHYRRHPSQLLMLLLGLWVAGALWSGVQAINASATNNYARAEALLNTGVDRLARSDGQPLTQSDFIQLRRAGVLVSPFLEGQLTTQEGQQLTILGIDPLTLANNSPLAATPDNNKSTGTLQDFITPPWQTRIAPDTRRQLGHSPALENNQALPQLIEVAELPPNTLVMDIAIAAQLLDSGETLSALLSPANSLTAAPLGFTLQRADTRASPGQLTQSFHLNLSAMALLALLVGLFIVQAALGLALEQRLGLLRTLRALGVTSQMLVLLLVLELLLLGLVGAIAGLISGLWLAKTLLPDVASTLHSLYGANVSDQLSLPWHYWLGGIGVTLSGLFIAGSGVLWRASRLSVLALGQAQSWRAGFSRQLSLQTRLGALAAIIALALGLTATVGHSGLGVNLPLLAGFGLVAALLLTAALWLAPFLAWVLSFLLNRLPQLSTRFPLTQWALADLQLQLPRLSLAMVALLIALAANLGVSSMVGGFRLTFLDWLDQRLLADIYITPPPAKFAEIDDWLAQQKTVRERLLSIEAESQLLTHHREQSEPQPLNLPLAIKGITPTPTLMTHWPLLSSLESAWQSLTHGEVFINEQLARGQGFSLNDQLSLTTPNGIISVTVVGIYPDYGNPKGELIMSSEHVQQRFKVAPHALGVILAPDQNVDVLRQQLLDNFNLAPSSLRDQTQVKATATAIFERTFAITRALNGLTLGVAALALFTSLLAQAPQRRRRLAPLWAMGVPLPKLLAIQLIQLAGSALLTALLAIPLGVAITACLVWIINVAAFGWRLPLHVFPAEISFTLLTAILVALLAAGLPMLKLWHTPPRALLAEEES